MKLNGYGEHPDRRRIKRWEPFDSGYKPALLLSSQIYLFSTSKHERRPSEDNRKRRPIMFSLKKDWMHTSHQLDALL